MSSVIIAFNRRYMIIIIPLTASARQGVNDIHRSNFTNFVQHDHPSINDSERFKTHHNQLTSAERSQHVVSQSKSAFDVDAVRTERLHSSGGHLRRQIKFRAETMMLNINSVRTASIRNSRHYWISASRRSYAIQRLCRLCSYRGTSETLKL